MDNIGNKKVLINTNPYHLKKNDFSNWYGVGDSMSVDTNNGVIMTLNNTKDCLGKLRLKLLPNTKYRLKITLKPELTSFANSGYYFGVNYSGANWYDYDFGAPYNMNNPPSYNLRNNIINIISHTFTTGNNTMLSHHGIYLGNSNARTTGVIKYINVELEVLS